jgi:hypothetical protein
VNCSVAAAVPRGILLMPRCVQIRTHGRFALARRQARQPLNATVAGNAFRSRQISRSPDLHHRSRCAPGKRGGCWARRTCLWCCATPERKEVNTPGIALRIALLGAATAADGATRRASVPGTSPGQVPGTVEPPWRAGTSRGSPSVKVWRASLLAELELPKRMPPRGRHERSHGRLQRVGEDNLGRVADV